MTEPRSQIGRLALRVEGDNWVAYYALLDSMVDAIPLGSIRMAAIRDNPARKEAFFGLMREVVADLFEETQGERPTWGKPKPAPEHERGGNA